MKEAFFSKEAMEYLQSRYPHINKSMFNGLLNMYGLQTNEKITKKIWCTSFRESRYSFEIPREVSDALGIADKIKFPDSVDVLCHAPIEDIDVIDALKYAYKHMDERDNKSLLTIELENETAIPKVFYKGEEITNKINVSFDWETKDSDPLNGGMRLNIEHGDVEVKAPNVKQINHRIGKYALDERRDNNERQTEHN